MVPRQAYLDLENFFADTAEAYADAVRGVYAAGYRYLLFDGTVWAYLCSGKEQRIIRDRGDDSAALMGVYKQIIQHALKAKPADMTITTHVCRGNFRST